MIRLTHDPLDPAALLTAVQTTAAGAVVLFLGTVREFTDGRQTAFLAYEAYPEMAERELQKLADEARRRWPITAVAIEHRLGELALGDLSVAVAVSAAHRDQAFEAGRFLIDELKRTVPIWKREHWVDGTTAWVHPGVPIPAVTETASVSATAPPTSAAAVTTTAVASPLAAPLSAAKGTP